MDAMPRSIHKDRNLARRAGACLGGSALVAPVLIFFGLTISSPRSNGRPDPSLLVVSVIVGVAFVTSFVALTRIERGGVGPTKHLWKISLVSNLVIVLALTIVFGFAGLLLSIMEVIAIAFHVSALNMPPRIATEPSNRSDR